MSTTSFRAPAKRSPASMPEYQRQNFATARRGRIGPTLGFSRGHL